jgi:hypothetical protein
MRAFLRSLWWRTPARVHQAVHSFDKYARYVGLRARYAARPTWALFREWRWDVPLLAVLAIVLYVHSNNGQRHVSLSTAFSTAGWTLLAMGVLIAAVFLWNLVLSGPRLYFAMKAELERKLWETTRELDRFRYPQERTDENAKARLRAISLQMGTELRDIRYKIELVRSTRPTPQYSHGFTLPAARWGEHHANLAEHPALYAAVEQAYTAAHRVNEALNMRRTRAGKPDALLGVIPDDGLDDAYEAAGRALDALGEPPGEAWETAAQRAVRGVTEDILSDLQEPRGE